VTQESVTSFWKKWAVQADRFPTWVGELYLERHQGTLTTEAQVKWYNRKLELALRELEWTSVLASLLAGAAYPSSRLHAIWQEMLLYQFHDILPGSSIKRVYDECIPRYREMLQKVTVSISGNDERFARTIDTSGMKKPFVVYNSLSWTREEWVQVGSKWVRPAVPSMGYKVVDANAQVSIPKVKATKTLLENDVLCVRFDQDGAIRSIFDKRVNRQVLAQDDDGSVMVGNRLAVYQDLGDAWDFAMDYAEFEPRYIKLVSAKAGINGPHAVLVQMYQLGSSRVIQRIGLVAGSPRLDFETHVEWYEPRSMLRTSFAVNVHAEEATYDIQFGHIRRPTHRNTTWDLARDEVPAHKWVDLAQRDYGVALLNDSKYGHKVKGNVIDLNLLRSVPYPGPRLVAERDIPPGGPDHNHTDQGEHFFTYALYPHIGDHIDGRVVQAGYELNVPLRTISAKSQQGLAPSEASFLEVSADNIIVEAVKKAETGNDVIVRLYECERRGTQATVRFHLPFSVVYETNLLEENIGLLPLRDGAVTLAFKPFEIKTLRMVIE
jgi:alpha-mannosidase